MGTVQNCFTIGAILLFICLLKSSVFNKVSEFLRLKTFIAFTKERRLSDLPTQILSTNTNILYQNQSDLPTQIWSTNTNLIYQHQYFIPKPIWSTNTNLIYQNQYYPSTPIWYTNTNLIYHCIEHFSSRRWTTIPALSVSYSVHEDEHFCISCEFTIA